MRTWFVAILEPDTPDPAAVADEVATAPGVITARTHRRTHRGHDELWLVLHVQAESRATAERMAHEALFRLIWPRARLVQEFGKEPWIALLGRHTEVGPIELETDILGNRPD